MQNPGTFEMIVYEFFSKTLSESLTSLGVVQNTTVGKQLADNIYNISPTLHSLTNSPYEYVETISSIAEKIGETHREFRRIVNLVDATKNIPRYVDRPFILSQYARFLESGKQVFDKDIEKVKLFLDIRNTKLREYPSSNVFVPFGSYRAYFDPNNAINLLSAMFDEDLKRIDQIINKISENPRKIRLPEPVLYVRQTSKKTNLGAVWPLKSKNIEEAFAVFRFGVKRIPLNFVPIQIESSDVENPVIREVIEDKQFGAIIKMA